MGKIIKRYSAPPDDPIFSGGTQMFSPQKFRPSSVTFPSDTTGETQEPLSSVGKEVEAKELGTRRIAQLKHRNELSRKNR